MNDLTSPTLSKIIMNIVLKSWSLISATKEELEELLENEVFHKMTGSKENPLNRPAYNDSLSKYIF